MLRCGGTGREKATPEGPLAKKAARKLHTRRESEQSQRLPPARPTTHLVARMVRVVLAAVTELLARVT